MELLYHYTSFDALIGILKDSGLCFWGSRYDSLNDPTEVNYSKDIVLSELIKSLEGTEHEWETKDAENVYAYIVSFSKKQDDINIWRLYNAEVAIVVDRDLLSKNSLQHVSIKDVKYPDIDDVPQIAVDLFNNSDSHDTCIETFNCEVFPFIKNIAYKIEDEVRMVSLDYDGFVVSGDAEQMSIVDAEIPQNVKCRGCRNGSLLLYKEFLIAKEALKKIVIRTHDEVYFNKVKRQIQVFLISNGYQADLPIEMTNSFCFAETKR